MAFSSNDDINAIYRGVIECSLPPKQWTHAAHFAAAIALINDRGDTAFDYMPRLITAYNEAIGTPNSDTEGYHHTITVASLLAARAMLEKHPKTQPLFECANKLLASAYGNPNWLLSYWHTELLFCARARRSWVEPDIKPLPFKL